MLCYSAPRRLSPQTQTFYYIFTHIALTEPSRIVVKRQRKIHDKLFLTDELEHFLGRVYILSVHVAFAWLVVVIMLLTLLTGADCRLLLLLQTPFDEVVDKNGPKEKYELYYCFCDI